MFFVEKRVGSLNSGDREDADFRWNSGKDFLDPSSSNHCFPIVKNGCLAGRDGFLGVMKVYQHFAVSDDRQGSFCSRMVVANFYPG